MLGRIFARITSTKLHNQHHIYTPLPQTKPSLNSGSSACSSSSRSSMSSASRGQAGGSGGESSSSSNSPPSKRELHALIAMMEGGISPKVLLNHLAPSFHIPPGADDMMLWRLLVSMIEPPKRRELPQYNTIEDVVELIKKSKKILVLSGAGISTSAGLPDFRSRNGIYVQIHAEHPDLQDPKSMFDIEYFRENPMPFYQFAKALYPGQYRPTIGHKFIKCIEDHNKLLRNYSQNIDTLEKQAGIKRVVECHGSFARATCTNCKYNVDGDDIREDIMNQRIPYCPRCQTKEDGPEDGLGVMKPNIVFFGEQLGSDFHNSLETDKEEADLLIVIGSSLKVKPVALIPKCVPPEIPQILINKEPLDHMGFDIELLGNCDDIIQELCLRLGQDWTNICETHKTPLTPIVGLPTETKTIPKLAGSTGNAALPVNQPPNASTNDLHSQGNSNTDHKPSTGDDKSPRGGPASSSRDASKESVEEDTEDMSSFKSNQANVDSETADELDDTIADVEVEPIITAEEDDDDDEEWEDIEIIGSSPGSSTILNPKGKANLTIPNSSYIYLKPKTYLFPGTELTNAQLANYTKERADTPSESSCTSSSAHD